MRVSCSNQQIEERQRRSVRSLFIWFLQFTDLYFQADRLFPNVGTVIQCFESFLHVAIRACTDKSRVLNHKRALTCNKNITTFTVHLFLLCF